MCYHCATMVPGSDSDSQAWFLKVFLFPLFHHQVYLMAVSVPVATASANMAAPEMSFAMSHAMMVMPASTVVEIQPMLYTELLKVCSHTNDVFMHQQ